MVIDYLLTGAIRIERLRHEERQRVGRRIEPLPVRGQMLLDAVKQRGTGQQVEKIVGVKVASMMAYPALLMRRGFMGKVHIGWRPNGGCLGGTCSVPGRQLSP